MTDEERQKLCAALRNRSDDWLPERMRTDVRDIAADEIDRLAAELDETRKKLTIAEIQRDDWKFEKIQMTNGTAAQSNAAAHVQHLRKRIRELEAEKRALYVAPPRLAALAQSDAEPYEIDPTKVICPNCTHQFRAISVVDQERLRAQSDAEPVAWQYRVKQGGWGGWHDAVPSREEAELCVELGRKASGGHLDDYEIRPLYAAPPRPDASAGLIEAAEWHEQEALRFAASPYTSDKMRGMMHKEDARKLRARAADRNME